MDEKFRAGGSALFIVIYFFLAIMILPVGIGMLLSYPNWISLFGGLLILAASLFIYAAIKQIKYNKSKEKFNQQLYKNIVDNKQEDITILNKEIAQSTNDAVENFIIAKWQIDKPTWNLFYKNEKKVRLGDIAIETSLIIILGTLMIKFFRSETYLIGFIISSIIGGIYAFLKFYLNMKSIAINKNAQAVDIIVTLSSVIINGKINVFRDDNCWMKSVKLKKDIQPLVIEIIYGWNTRRGNTTNELRFPVNNEDTANTIIQALTDKQT
jgi:membrane protein implicated in regulation of membrane protease activity